MQSKLFTNYCSTGGSFRSLIVLFLNNSVSTCFFYAVQLLVRLQSLQFVTKCECIKLVAWPPLQISELLNPFSVAYIRSLCNRKSVSTRRICGRYTPCMTFRRGIKPMVLSSLRSQRGFTFNCNYSEGGVGSWQGRKVCSHKSCLFGRCWFGY